MQIGRMIKDVEPELGLTTTHKIYFQLYPLTKKIAVHLLKTNKTLFHLVRKIKGRKKGKEWIHPVGTVNN